jgi:hypothetical protein
LALTANIALDMGSPNTSLYHAASAVHCASLSLEENQVPLQQVAQEFILQTIKSLQQQQQQPDSTIHELV